jgi:hypothetical protein
MAYKPLQGTKKDDTLNGTAGDDTINGQEGNDKIYGKAGNDLLYGGKGKNTLVGGADADTYYLTGGKENADTIIIAQNDSSLTLAKMQNIISTGVVTDIDKINGFDKFDKLDLDIKGIAKNANVDTTYDTAHFKNYSIKDGMLTLKNGNTAVDVTSKELLKEAFTYALNNLKQLPNDVAVGLKVTIDGTAHTLILVDHTQPGVTAVDIVGTLNALDHNQIF